MSIGTVVLILLVILLFGGFAPWGAYSTSGHFYGTGYGGGSALTAVVVVLLVLLLLGRI